MKPSSSQPIGIFDSGIGGLTVTRAVTQLLPNEQIIYYGDTIHLPYGDKSLDAIRYYCLKISKFLIDQGCKMIVVACNSASSAAYEVLLDFFQGDILFVNVVDPLVEAVAPLNPKKIGIIATKATVHSGVYQKKIAEASPSSIIAALPTPLLTVMIEEGYISNNISEAVIESYLSAPMFEGMEVLLLACTHYPLIKPSIEAFLEYKVNVMTSSDVVAKEVERVLRENALLNPGPRPPHRIYVSDYTESFENTTRLFYKGVIELKPHSIW